ncbi:glutamate/gamma-aminobutyrate family transporter YjeM [Sporolactobacillus shoreicorticis]|uniref:Glutamate/gamma-aminobutyrate family transporter YjeM n=1 Tax=Sporolactobacillus shoreicorticis TaxID=1923877 RepID=A0ABW5RYI1_9BACL|nr:glutamate/gamma-aminobutyrate family transporter YjeM [Sporolactobacillus shoreicorticis]MCO7125188.1 glutamate/gamma-aminobutyrate family transporter YjeM [Sporolactobacillus shoreicorticis]
MSDKAVNLSLVKLVIIIATTVYSFTSMSNAFYLMSYAAIPWYILAGILFFIPYALIVSEYTGNFKNQSGGIYSWIVNSTSPRVAFMTVFLWYSSYTIWMASLFMKFWIPLSILFFGEDRTTSSRLVLGIPQIRWLGLGSLVAVALVALLISRGFTTISHFMLLGGVFILILFGIAAISNLFVLIHNNFTFSQPFQGMHSLLAAQNPTYQGLFGNLGFFIFGITAFGGLDTVASLVDKTGTGKNKFPKAILIATFVIAGTYLSGIFLWGASANWHTLFANKDVSLGNAMYFLMQNLGEQVGQISGLSADKAALVGQVYLRITGLALFWAYVGLLVTISYAPLKAIIEGTPKSYWPKALTRKNKHNIVRNAVWVQAVLIIGLVLLVSFGNAKATSLYNNLTLMTNVSRSIPYLIVALSFPLFRRKRSTYELLTESQVPWASGTVSVSIVAAIIFTVIQPITQARYLDSFFLIIGPIAFSLIALWLYRQFQKKISANLAGISNHRS